MAELCGCTDQIPPSFNKKLKRETVSYEKMIEIADALNVGYEHVLILPNAEKIEFHTVSNLL